MFVTVQIITSEEAERRGQVYDCQGATYLFDLDYVEDVYTVDAAHQGNISHFVNHSVSGLHRISSRFWPLPPLKLSIGTTLFLAYWSDGFYCIYSL